MKNLNASDRAVALVHEAIAVLQRAEQAPTSPVNVLLNAAMRRKFRRDAKRLRARKSRPRYPNLHSAEELAGIYERTVQRDEILERGLRDFQRITQELGQVLQKDDPAFETAMKTLILEAARSAEEQGPGSEAARRFRLLRFVAWLTHRAHSHRRRQRPPAWPVSLAPDPSIEARHQLTAAEVLDSPPPAGETVVAIPPEDRGSGRGRIFLRIGIGDAAWIGSFEIGHMSVSTIVMMPDDKHLFVSAEGAGYIIDLKSRTLVEEIGTDVAGVMVDRPRTLFVVDHDGMSLEAFGKSGRLWKTERISSGGFRETAITDHSIIGEARQSSPPGWVAFSVNLATGDVRIPPRPGR